MDATNLELCSEQLKARGFSLVLAESCTGGALAAAVTDIPGASCWFAGSLVTYSNAAKCRWLAVDADLLAEHGAVSEQVAQQMAEGALQAMPSAQVAVSVTGIAGPSGAVAGKPVGTVCYAFIVGKTPVVSMTCHFQGDRQAVRMQAMDFVWRTLLDSLLVLDY